MSEQTARIKITSDGTRIGTKIFVGDEQLGHVQSVRFDYGIHDPKPTVTLTIRKADIEVDAPDVNIVEQT